MKRYSRKLLVTLSFLLMGMPYAVAASEEKTETSKVAQVEKYYEQKLNEANNINEKLQKDLNDQITKLQTLDVEIGKKNVQIKKCQVFQDSQSNNNKVLADTNKDLLKKLKNVKNNNEALKIKNELLLQKINNVDAEYDPLVKNNKFLKNKYTQLKDENKIKEINLNEVKNLNQEWQSKYRILKNKSPSLNKHNKLMTSYNILKPKYNHLKKINKIQRVKIGELTLQLEKMNAEVTANNRVPPVISKQKTLKLDSQSKSRRDSVTGQQINSEDLSGLQGNNQDYYYDQDGGDDDGQGHDDGPYNTDEKSDDSVSELSDGSGSYNDDNSNDEGPNVKIVNRDGSTVFNDNELDNQSQGSPDPRNTTADPPPKSEDENKPPETTSWDNRDIVIALGIAGYLILIVLYVRDVAKKKEKRVKKAKAKKA